MRQLGRERHSVDRVGVGLHDQLAPTLGLLHHLHADRTCDVDFLHHSSCSRIPEPWMLHPVNRPFWTSSHAWRSLTLAAITQAPFWTGSPAISRSWGAM